MHLLAYERYGKVARVANHKREIHTDPIADQDLIGPLYTYMSRKELIGPMISYPIVQHT